MKNYKNFECLDEFEFKGIPLKYYISKASGIKIALAQIKGPLVNGFITVATEASDHNGNVLSLIKDVHIL